MLSRDFNRAYFAHCLMSRYVARASIGLRVLIHARLCVRLAYGFNLEEDL